MTILTGMHLMLKSYRVTDGILMTHLIKPSRFTHNTYLMVLTLLLWHQTCELYWGVGYIQYLKYSMAWCLIEIFIYLIEIVV